MLIRFDTSICLYQAHWLTTMESVYGLGRRDTLCAYVSHGEYILSRAVPQETTTSAIVATIELVQIEVDKYSSIPLSDYCTAHVWPTGEMNGKLDYAKFFWRLPRQPVKV